MMSSNITRVSSTSQSAFNRMSQSANQVTGRNRILGMSFNELQNKIRQVESVISNSNIPSQIAQARRELASLQRMSANHSGNIGGSSTSGAGSKGTGIGGIAIGSMLGGMATAGIGMAASAIKDGIGTVISQSFQKEQAITGLSTFLGKEGANDAYKNIRKDANATPFDTASLLEVNRALISAGENAVNARKTSLDLANAVSAVGGGNDVLSRMAANMQQVKTVGKATAMDIRQFGMAGINIYEMLAKSTGKNINQVKEMDVTYEQLQQALAMSSSKGGIYEGAMEAQSNTMAGKWGTVKDNFLTAASDIGDALSPIFNRVLDIGIKAASKIGPIIERATPYIDSFATSFGMVVDFITQITTGTGGWSDYLAIAKGYIEIVWNHVKNMALKMWELVSSIMEFIKNSELLKDTFTAIGWIMEKVFGIIGLAFDALIWIWDNVINPLFSKIEWIYKKLKEYFNKEVKIEAKVDWPAPPKIPKLPPNNPGGPLGNTAGMMASNEASGKSAGESVSGAGPKTVNIHVGKFFDNLQFTTLNTNETADEIEKIVMECFARVVYNGAKMV